MSRCGFSARRAASVECARRRLRGDVEPGAPSAAVIAGDRDQASLVGDVALEGPDDLVAVQLADVVGLLGDADEQAAAQRAQQADDVGGGGVAELEGVGDLARLDDDDVRDLEDRAEQRRAELVQPPGPFAVGVAVDQAEGDRVRVAVLAGAPDAPEVRARDGALAGEGGGQVVVGAVVDDPDDDRRRPGSADQVAADRRLSMGALYARQPLCPIARRSTDVALARMVSGQQEPPGAGA